MSNPNKEPTSPDFSDRTRYVPVAEIVSSKLFGQLSEIDREGLLLDYEMHKDRQKRNPELGELYLVLSDSDYADEGFEVTVGPAADALEATPPQ